MLFGNAQSEAVVEHRFKIFAFEIVVVHLHIHKERRGGHLLGVAHYHRALCAGERRHRLACGHL